jgi:hypothetical protein
MGGLASNRAFVLSVTLALMLSAVFAPFLSAIPMVCERDDRLGRLAAQPGRVQDISLCSYTWAHRKPTQQPL